MSLCFNEFMRYFVNKFSNLKITHCISSPVLLNREAFLRTSRADSTSDLEGRSAQVLHHSNFRRHNHRAVIYYKLLGGGGANTNRGVARVRGRVRHRRTCKHP